MSLLMSYVKREEVVGKSVIGPDGNSVGSVKDLAFSTKGDVGLVISKKDGAELTVSIRLASAIGEFVLLSAAPTQSTSALPQSAPAAQMVCPSCKSKVRPGARFCGRCGYKLTWPASTT